MIGHYWPREEGGKSILQFDFLIPLTQVSKVFDRFINVHTLKITFSQCTIRELHKDSLNDDTVREVIRRFPQLKVLKMFACHNLSNRILNTFPNTIEQLVLYNGRRWVLIQRVIS